MRRFLWVYPVLLVAAVVAHAAEPSPPLPSPQLSPNWKLQLLANITENPADAALRPNRFRAEHATDASRIHIESAMINDQTTDEFHLNARQDWLFPDQPWFIFAQGDYEADKSATWRHRLGPYAGVGLNLRQPGPDLTLRLGAGFIQDINSQQNIPPETRLGSELTWQLTRRQKLSAAATLYPDIDDNGAYRLTTSADWSFTLDRAAAILLNVGIRNGYESAGIDGYSDHDLQVFAGVTLKF